jgi:Domain of unknown function (DUF4326)
MTKPIRLQLFRTKGFRLQDASRFRNGLGAVRVARPSKWGNPFVVGVRAAGFAVAADEARILAHYADFRKNVDLWDRWPLADAATAVQAFREMRCNKTFVERARKDLRGKNLACWCKAGEPCHADVLLELANSPVCEAV